MNGFFKALVKAWRAPPKVPLTPDEVLLEAGWYPGRVCVSAVEDFERAFGSHFHPKARGFIGSYGNLVLGGTLFISCADLDERYHPFRELSNVLHCNVCPVGDSFYMSSESMLWLDESGNFYVVDAEIDVWFIASTTAKAFEVLFFRTPREREVFFNLERSPENPRDYT